MFPEELLLPETFRKRCSGSFSEDQYFRKTFHYFRKNPSSGSSGRNPNGSSGRRHLHNKTKAKKKATYLECKWVQGLAEKKTTTELVAEERREELKKLSWKREMKKRECFRKREKKLFKCSEGEGVLRWSVAANEMDEDEWMYEIMSERADMDYENAEACGANEPHVDCSDAFNTSQVFEC
ncbi:hypothetical protein GmHk_02G004582 [Glycine max]|nr:hypothetical protein GmHk_02G004582 [Glycine max]KAH1261806.1 hypothetical protein GmHk_02G004582 [Glycine max]